MYLLLIIGGITFCVAQYVLARKGCFYTSLVLAILYSLLTVLYLQSFMFLIVIVLWALFLIGIKIRKNNEKTSVNKLAVFSIIFTTVMFLGFGYYFLNGVVTEGYITIEEHNLFAENGKYYLYLDEQKIEVSEELYNQVELNSRYHFKYSWNKLLTKNGKFEVFELDS
ncbi:hypothetical protein AWH56_018760 [Anaerobacillus isosaccharinicus]|uniref:Uncharacterized protein n=1 Tax=Anaerobacillus isosaccharinicus TaxID=1532552 RepID=A0A1S2L634_9BACI|nr:hypothetical protein [Anaerobacillus isosaccharinicus]MBA5587053.1 hypothetical protein [Anaerobacillus isosaccharinicus]QOY34750.1 hypothetical protein AWH56_018760 [Anaerobacillus isosaccharinicus]